MGKAKARTASKARKAKAQPRGVGSTPPPAGPTREQAARLRRAGAVWDVPSANAQLAEAARRVHGTASLAAYLDFEQVVAQAVRVMYQRRGAEAPALKTMPLTPAMRETVASWRARREAAARPARSPSLRPSGSRCGWRALATT